MKKLSNKRKSSAAKSTLPPDDPVRAKRILNIVTIGIGLSIAIVLIAFLKNGLWRSVDESPEAAQAREVAATWARVERDWQRVKGSRMDFWSHYVADAPQHLASYAALLRQVAEGSICKENPSVDGKILSYEQLEKVAILREYQCLEYAQEDLIRIAGSEDGVGFLGSTMALLREEYQKPIPSQDLETPSQS